MSKLKPDGYSWVIPFLHVRDPEAALSGLESVFGFRRVHVNEQDGRIVHGELEYRGDVVAMVAPEGSHGESGVSPASRGGESSMELLVYIEDADVCYAKAVELGWSGVEEPRDWPWGERHAHITDPDGYRWLLAETLAETST